MKTGMFKLVDGVPVELGEAEAVSFLLEWEAEAADAADAAKAAQEAQAAPEAGA